MTTQKEVSPVKKQILDFLIEGLSNKEIARRLGISDNTVRNYLTALFKRFEIKTRSRTELAIVWLKLQLPKREPVGYVINLNEGLDAPPAWSRCIDFTGDAFTVYEVIPRT